MQKKEGYINTLGGKVRYEIMGEEKATPLVVVHGGPGLPHDYLEPLEDLANNRQVIFYDQLGCGKSDRPTDKTLWTVERYTDELKVIINALGLKQYHLLGQSWGAALAVSFALTKPKGLKSMILSDPYISTPLWQKDADRLIGLLPKDMQEAIKSGPEDTEEYKKAVKEYYKRFVGDPDPLPDAFTRARAGFNRDIYRHMWGTREFDLSGTLKDFDPTDRLHEINVPVLLLCGRNDEATPESTQYFQKQFPNAQMYVFEKSEHYPFWNERQEFIQTVSDFLRVCNRVDELAKIIWDFNNQQDLLEKSDCILVLGSNDIRVAQYGARLFLDDYAPLIIFSGNVGRLTKDMWQCPEADVFAEEAKKMGVPESRILIENRSTNTGENLEFTKNLLNEKNVNPQSFIVVQKPYMQKRAWATFKKVFPDKKVIVTAPDVLFEDYPNEILSKDHIINIMVGDLQRLKVYAERGFSVPVDIPENVWSAYQELVKMGYTSHLV